MLGKGRIDERFLPLQGLDRATAWFSIIVETRVRNLRIELRHCSEAQSSPSVPVVKWLAQDELAAVSIVAEIEPVGNRNPAGQEKPEVRSYRLAPVFEIHEVGCVRIPLTRRAPKTGQDIGAKCAREFTMIQKRSGRCESRSVPDASRPIKLPRPALQPGGSLARALQLRRSTREISSKKLPLQTLSNLLWAA